MRRYVASYFAPNFLLPPTDLMHVSSAAQKWLGAKTEIIDAVAKKLCLEDLLTRLKKLKPDWLFYQIGFATLEDDLALVDKIKSALPDVPAVVMGYLPTVFPEKILQIGQADYVIRGEPEQAFTDLVKTQSEQRPLDDIPGIAFRNGDNIVVTKESERINDLDSLPFADHLGIDLGDYNEPFLGKRVATIFTSRGCPYGCTFCVRTYGRKLVMRSAASVLKEISWLVDELEIECFRFMDDTINVNGKRLEEICRGIIELDKPLRWTCLARPDMLTPDLVKLMKKAGCRRMYVGIESGSESILKAVNKGMSLNDIRSGVALCKKQGIEVSGFFIVGVPGETEEDFETSVRFACELDLDYIIVTRLQYWPGTLLSEQGRGDLECANFKEFIPKDKEAYELALKREQEFYRRFYMRPGYIVKRAWRLLQNPKDLATATAKVLRYAFSDQKEDFI